MRTVDDYMMTLEIFQEMSAPGSVTDFINHQSIQDLLPAAGF